MLGIKFYYFNTSYDKNFLGKVIYTLSGREKKFTLVTDAKMYLGNTIMKGRYCEGVFSNCSAKFIDISQVNTSLALNMNGLFLFCNKLEGVKLGENFDARNAEFMGSMFERCINLKEIDAKNIRTKNAKEMAYMFKYCLKLEKLELSGFNTENVTDMKSMFEGCESLEELDISSFDTRSAEDMSYMFAECGKLKKLNIKDSFVPGKHTQGMFSWCKSLEGIDVDKFEHENEKYIEDPDDNMEINISIE